MKQISETEFQADWLSLREKADHAARDAGLLTRAAKCVSPGKRVLDLGCGTGSTARAFEAHGFTDLDWCFLDNDPALLQVARKRHPEAQFVQKSLTDIDALPLENVGLVTASALLDLMSETWVAALADRLQALDISFYAALNFDGLMRWRPASDQDAVIAEAFNRHQQTDKGFGPALGPASGTAVARVFSDRGFDVSVGHSAWCLGPEDQALHRELINGISAAAMAAGESGAKHWLDAKRGIVGSSHVVIGHDDVLAIAGARNSAIA